MAKRAVNNFTDEWFESRGYVKTDNGGWSPPPIKSKYIKNLMGQEIIPSGTTHADTKDILIQYPKEFIIQKVKVNETPDFTIKPVTEWFIPYQTPSKKNSRITFTNKKTGRVVNIPSQKYTEYNHPNQYHKYYNPRTLIPVHRPNQRRIVHKQKH